MERGRVEVRRGRDRFVTRADGLVSRHGFSFGAHYDPGNVAYGALLASNEDVVQTARGYDSHPHADTEIVTWVLSGSLLHQDSAGNSGILHPGLVQRLSAGSGIVHAERNDAFRLEPEVARKPVHFLQMWLRPDVTGTVPGYASRELTDADLRAGWVPVVSSDHPDAAVAIGTAGATLWVARPPDGTALRLPEGRFVHLHVARGTVDVEAVGRLGPGDAVRADGGGLAMTAAQNAELLVWTLA